MKCSDIAILAGVFVCVALLGIIPGCSSGPDQEPKVCNEWYCERTGMTLKVENDHAHFVDKDGAIVAICKMKTKQRGKVWEIDGKSDFVISKVSEEELYVGSGEGNKVAGVYIPTSEKDYVLPIDLDGRNHIDINVEVVPGEKPKVTVVDKLASTEDSDE